MPHSHHHHFIMAFRARCKHAQHAVEPHPIYACLVRYQSGKHGLAPSTGSLQAHAAQACILQAYAAPETYGRRGATSKLQAAAAGRPSSTSVHMPGRSMTAEIASDPRHRRCCVYGSRALWNPQHHSCAPVPRPQHPATVHTAPAVTQPTAWKFCRHDGGPREWCCGFTLVWQGSRAAPRCWRQRRLTRSFHGSSGRC